MATKLEIWNLALGRQGQGSLDSTTPDNALSTHLDLVYAHDFLTELEAFDYAFARVYAKLTDSATASEDIAGLWCYDYDIPADALAIRHVGVEGDDQTEYPWEIRLRSDANGAPVTPKARGIFAEHGDAYARYTMALDPDDDDDVGLVTNNFVEALSKKLEVGIGMLVSQDEAKLRTLEAMYKVAMSAAQTRTAEQRYRRGEIPGRRRNPAQIGARTGEYPVRTPSVGTRLDEL